MEENVWIGVRMDLARFDDVWKREEKIPSLVVMISSFFLFSVSAFFLSFFMFCH